MKGGFARAEVKRFQSEECILECLLFEWFLRDIVVSAELGRRAGAIRQGLLGSILSGLERSGLSPAVPVNFHRVQRERFAEYTRVLEAGESLQALGALAWVRILGRNEPSDRMTMLLAMRATAELGALRGIRKRYLS